MAASVRRACWNNWCASHDHIGDVLVAQGDEPGALAAYRHSLALREALAVRAPANTQWQTDVAESCAKLGTVEHGQSVETRRDCLMRGRSILLTFKAWVRVSSVATKPPSIPSKVEKSEPTCPFPGS